PILRFAAAEPGPWTSTCRRCRTALEPRRSVHLNSRNACLDGDVGLVGGGLPVGRTIQTVADLWEARLIDREGAQAATLTHLRSNPRRDLQVDGRRAAADVRHHRA